MSSELKQGHESPPNQEEEEKTTTLDAKLWKHSESQKVLQLGGENPPCIRSFGVLGFPVSSVLLMHA